MKKFISLSVILTLILVSSMIFAWTENVSLTGLDGQTVGAASSASGNIDMDANNYHLIVIHLVITPEASVTSFSWNIEGSVDSGTTKSVDYIDSGSGSTSTVDKFIKIYAYPYVTVNVINNTTESGSSDDLSVWCKYAVY